MEKIITGRQTPPWFCFLADKIVAGWADPIVGASIARPGILRRKIPFRRHNIVVFSADVVLRAANLK